MPLLCFFQGEVPRLQATPMAGASGHGLSPAMPSSASNNNKELDQLRSERDFYKKEVIIEPIIWHWCAHSWLTMCTCISPVYGAKKKPPIFDGVSQFRFAKKKKIRWPWRNCDKIRLNLLQKDNLSHTGQTYIQKGPCNNAVAWPLCC